MLKVLQKSCATDRQISFLGEFCTLWNNNRSALTYPTYIHCRWWWIQVMMMLLQKDCTQIFHCLQRCTCEAYIPPATGISYFFLPPFPEMMMTWSPCWNQITWENSEHVNSHVRRLKFLKLIKTLMYPWPRCVEIRRILARLHVKLRRWEHCACGWWWWWPILPRHGR